MITFPQDGDKLFNHFKKHIFRLILAKMVDILKY